MNKRGLVLLPALLFLALLLFGGCGQDQNSRDDIPPSAPVWVPRSADDAYSQQGIRAEPVADDRQHRVRLEWYANPEPDVAIYRVLRKAEWDSSLHHLPIKDLHLGLDLPYGQGRYSWADEGVDPESETSDVLAPDPETGLSRGYYWELQAIDSAGNKSAYSPRIYYRLLANPTNLVVGHDTSSLYSVAYHFSPNSNDEIPQYDMIRVYSQYYGPDSVVWFSSPPIQRYEEQWSVGLFHDSHLPLTRDCTYVCQINVICNRPNVAHTEALAGAAAYTTFVYHP